MRIEPKEKTARNTSVGADARQSIQKDSDNSIPASEAKGNGEMENLEEMYRKMQRMADPRYLHTLTMTELFQTSYKSRPPIIENLLHSGCFRVWWTVSTQIQCLSANCLSLPTIS